MRRYILRNRQAYEQLSAEYEKRSWNKSIFEERSTVLAGALLRQIKSRKAKTILEIGPGSGEILAFFESRGCRTVAVELSSAIATIASQRSPRSTVIVSDILSIDFPPAHFDGIYAGAIIHLFRRPDALQLLLKCHRWLKCEGALFVNTTLHNRVSEGYRVKADYNQKVSRFRRQWTERSFLQALNESGFVVMDRLFTDEKNRSKQWVAFILKKQLHERCSKR